MSKQSIKDKAVWVALGMLAMGVFFLVGSQKTVNADKYLLEGRYQIFQAGGDSDVKIFDSQAGILRHWSGKTVTTFDFNDHRQIPEKRTYRE